MGGASFVCWCFLFFQSLVTRWHRSHHRLHRCSHRSHRPSCCWSRRREAACLLLLVRNSPYWSFVNLGNCIYHLFKISPIKLLIFWLESPTSLLVPPTSTIFTSIWTSTYLSSLTLNQSSICHSWSIEDVNSINILSSPLYSNLFLTFSNSFCGGTTSLYLALNIQQLLIYHIIQSTYLGRVII